MKIKISYLWIPFLPIVYGMHLYKILFFLFLLMSIHESFHIVCAYCLGYKIDSVCIYPFGLSAQIQDFEYKNSLNEIIITLCGLSVHLFAAFFIPMLSGVFDLSHNFTLYLLNANYAILLFNLMPIYPLDGGRIVRNILEYIFSFKVAKFLSLCVSMIFIPILFYLFAFTKIQIICFTLFFLIQIFLYLYRFKEDVYDFYLYRYIHYQNRKLKFHHHNDIYKNCENYLVKEGNFIHELEFLSKHIE